MSLEYINLEDIPVFFTKDISKITKVSVSKVPEIIDKNAEYDLMFFKKNSRVIGYFPAKGEDILERMGHFKGHEGDKFVIAPSGSYKKIGIK